VAEKLQFVGLLESAPFAATGQGAKFTANFDERMTLDHSLATSFELTVDTAVSVPFGALTGVNVVYIRTVGGKVRMRVTSADGTSQSVPVDPYCVILSNSVDITALDVTRVAATPTVVTILIGKKS
jgi:hypothetical protein